MYLWRSSGKGKWRSGIIGKGIVADSPSKRDVRALDAHFQVETVDSSADTNEMMGVKVSELTALPPGLIVDRESLKARPETSECCYQTAHGY